MNKFLYTAIIIAWLAISAAQPVLASEISAEGPTSPVATGSLFQVRIYIESIGQPVNAFSGGVSIPEGLSFESVSLQGSVAVSWIQKPEYNDGEVSFSGIIPGGFEGVYNPLSGAQETGQIFRLNLRAVRDGSHDVRPVISEAYANSEDHELIVFSSRITRIESSGVLSLSDEDAAIDDVVAPEPFTIILGQDDRVWDGRNFIIFETSDAGSGVSFYTVTEGRRAPVAAESPYVLQDQSLKSDIIVRAYDESGNMRAAELRANWSIGLISWRSIILCLFAATVLGCIIIYVYRMRLTS